MQVVFRSILAAFLTEHQRQNNKPTIILQILPLLYGGNLKTCFEIFGDVRSRASVAIQRVRACVRACADTILCIGIGSDTPILCWIGYRSDETDIVRTIMCYC